jgi:ATP-binding protein involved in chromosome partitioning
MSLRSALKRVSNPATGRDIVGEGLVLELSLSPAGVAKANLQTDDPRILEDARAEIGAVPGVARAVVVGLRAAPAPSHHDPIALPRPRIETAAKTLVGVKHVIAVASGKGGVGKSTIAANLAVALARRGLDVGLMDADIYGPSLPILFGLTKKPEMREGKIAPIDAFGVRAMSIGLLVDPAKAIAWRGPMVMGAVRQLMSDVDWGKLDVLVIDTPPGTGDAHLSLAQSKRLTGAIIVSTPQEMALADMRRGIELFRATGVPILGVVENMAFLDAAGERHYIFGKGGAERAADEAGAPFLGALPIYPDLRKGSDEGRPIAALEPNAPASVAFAALAEKIATRLLLSSSPEPVR